MPTSFPQIRTLPEWPDLATALESALARHAGSRTKTAQYVTCNIRNNPHRTTLGLPETSLTINRKPLVSEGNGSRMHSCCAYLGSSESFTSVDKKALDLQSINILWYGQPTIWVVIPPQHAARLEALVAQETRELPRCGQFVRHASLVMSPSELIRWEIDFNIFAQFPGEVIKIEENAYFFTWKTGEQISETVNSYEWFWSAPPLYRCCCTDTICALDLVENYRPSSSSRLDNSPFQPGMSIHADISLHDIEAACFHGREVGTDHETMEDEESAYTEISVYFSPLQHIDWADTSAESRLTSPGDLHPEYGTPILPVGGNCVRGEGGSEQASANVPDKTPSEIGPFDPFGTEYFFPSSSLGIDADMLEGGPNPQILTHGFPSHHDFSSGWAGQIRSAEALQPDASGSGTTADDFSIPLSTSFEEPLLVLEGDMNTAERCLPPGQTCAEQYGWCLTAPIPTGSTSTMNFESKAVIFDQEIEDLIALALRHEWRLLWKVTNAPDAKSILDSFRPRKLLNNNAIQEILLIMTTGRNDVHIVTSEFLLHSFIENNQASTAMILFPIRDGEHCFLLSVNGLNRMITIHDNKQHDDIVNSFSSAKLGDSLWEFRYKKTVKDDGKNSGIVLLLEAEMLIRGYSRIVENLESLRLRYLRLLVGELLAEKSSWSLFCRDATSTETLMTPALLSTYNMNTIQEQRPFLRDANLDQLASAIGCGTVLHDFAKIAQNVHSTSEKTTSTIAAVMEVFDCAETHRFVAGLQKDLSGLIVASNFRALVSRFRDELKENKKERKKLSRMLRAEGRSPPAQPEHPHAAFSVKGRGAESKAYDVLIDIWRQPEKPSPLRKRLQAANYHGQPLLMFEDVCGLEYPMWVMLPMRDIPCPEDPQVLIKPEMYVLAAS
ncbi:uncharacterized protein A1O5_12681 [Cladophialophora psammophila CBS 110553]|uniref:JmjC domain-containing protein n=1 Tax=Cladophialophora psammophila CBS 110553 TaxID=1182543 RepID=W9VT59_9EURO|nr:uncharacterized protein A1O5_12681 [Cladophialophora psammophila CBS 110553]EXJ56225.1 hypothetical protein A1O5_12681 [Cladophialophora psammophila CBS 110553]